VSLPRFGEVETLVRIRPFLSWFAHSLVSRPASALRRFYQAGHPTDEETAKCPEPLCPTLVLPPLGRRNFHLLRGRYPSVLALTGSCATPLGLSHPSAFRLVRRVFAGCTQPLLPTGSFPTLSLKIFPWMLDPVPRRSHRVLLPVSSPVSSAFPQRRWGRLPALIRESRLLAGPCFRGCRYFLMFRPPSLLTPQIVPTAAHIATGQPGLLRPGISCFVTSARTGYANRPNTGN
jgi:hypothetical protein